MGSVVRQPLLGRRSRRLTRRRRTLAAGAALVGLLVAGCSTSPASAPSTSLSTSPAGPDDLVVASARDRAVHALLEARAAAVVARDPGALRASETSGADVPATARLRALPLASWRYDVDAVPAYDPAQPTLLRVTARLAYRFTGEESDTEVAEDLDLVYADGAWRVAAERSTGDRVAPWSLGDVVVASGRRSLVVGIGVTAARARAVAVIADAAVPVVTGVWGSDWSQRAVVVLTATNAQAAAGLGRDSLGAIAAMTTTVGSAGSGSRASARIWASDQMLGSVASTGQAIVLRHELVHVATGATATAATPMWLEEGFAELVGYRGSGVALDRSVRALLVAAREGRAPDGLPSDDDFAGPRSGLAYPPAHLACDLLARRLGLAGLVRLYRATAAGGGEGTTDVDSALRAATGEGTDGLTVAWRAELARLAR